ncbi:uncharacterized protein LOC133553669 [Nerophis ophidion]|uniref:uncharacterized protein LOC133553669 n=1 Tax=Nerophis ophidion TaxID=159077 RepID=UPI002AE05CBD|nr:uncharacterized protein LOC133553669 [Nerophis ophidion]
MGQIWHIICEEAEQKIRNMKATAGLLVLLLTVCHAEEKACDGRKDGVQCYGKLGEPMLLRLMDNADALFIYIWKKTTTILMKVNGRKVNLTERRFSFTPEEGLMKIEKLERRDSDKYTLTIYNNQGRLISSRTLQLFVEAPVISVQIASKCLPQGEQQVSCSAEGGDNPKYEWTLDGKPLPLTELPGRFQANITLTKHQSGQLRCSVRNNVSHVREETRIWTCVFINCTSNGTRISQWLPETKRSLCDEQIKGIGAPQNSVPGANSTLCDQITLSLPACYWLIIQNGILAPTVLVIILVMIFFTLKKKPGKRHRAKEDQELMYANVSRETNASQERGRGPPR